MATTWRYCITRERYAGDIRYSIREVYEDAEGNLSWTTEPEAPEGETWHELADDLARYASAMNGNVLDLTLDPPALVKPIRGSSA